MAHGVGRTLSAVLLVSALLAAVVPDAHGQRLNARVVLSLELDLDTLCEFGSRSFFRVNSDGSLETVPFVVPNNRALIVTDVHWSADPAPTVFTPGRATRLTLAIFSGTEFVRAVYRSSPVFITTENQNALVGGADHLTTGFVVGPGKALCPFANTAHPLGSSTNTPVFVLLYGHLIND
jgi:hypothetical protein